MSEAIVTCLVCNEQVMPHAPHFHPAAPAPTPQRIGVIDHGKGMLAAIAAKEKAFAEEGVQIIGRSPPAPTEPVTPEGEREAMELLKRIDFTGGYQANFETVREALARTRAEAMEEAAQVAEGLYREVISRQYENPTAFQEGVNKQIRLLAAVIPEVAAAIRAKGGR